MDVPNRIAVPLIGIFVILLLATLSLAASFLMPVTAAILLYLVLSRPRRLLTRLGVPPGATAMLFTTMIFASFGAAMMWFAEPVGELLEDLPWQIERAQRAFAISGGGALTSVTEAVEAIEGVIEGEQDGSVGVAVVEDKASATVDVLTLAPRVIGQIAFTIFLLFFLISSGDFFLERAVESIPGFTNKRLAVDIVHAVEDRLGRYLGSITLINAVLGLAIGLAMYAWGMPNAIGFGVLAFALNYIPFLGAILGAASAAFVAFVTFGTPGFALAVGATYAVLTAVEGQVVTPALVARRLKLNAPILFLTVAFFAYIWSAVGMVVAVPILIVAKIVCDEIEGLRAVGYFLGDTGDRPALARAGQPE